MNVYLGIDWSEAKHDLCWMNDAGAVLAQQCVPHSVDGFAKLDDARVRLGLAPDDCMVGLETAPGARSLIADRLPVGAPRARGYSRVFILAPGMINSVRRRFRQSGARNDTSDARVIAAMHRRCTAD